VSALAELIARVEGLKGPDRDVDLAIASAIVPDVIVMRQRDDDTGADPYTYWCYTASIDAVVALIERELPGWDIVTQSRDNIGSVALAEPKDGKSWGECIKATSSPLDRPMPLAYCLAFLRALEASRGGER
jgi:hypothetical protein